MTQRITVFNSIVTNIFMTYETMCAVDFVMFNHHIVPAAHHPQNSLHMEALIPAQSCIAQMHAY